MAATMLNPLFVSFVNVLSFHYKRHVQNKADSTVDKTRHPLNLFVQSWVYE